MHKIEGEYSLAVAFEFVASVMRQSPDLRQIRKCTEVIQALPHEIGHSGTMRLPQLGVRVAELLELSGPEQYFQSATISLVIDYPIG